MPHESSSFSRGSAGSRLALVTVHVIGLPSRVPSRAIADPTAVSSKIRLNTGISSGAREAAISLPLRRLTTSPACRPAASAGEPPINPPTRIPDFASIDLSKGCATSPIQLRSTCPLAINSSATLRARFEGIAPPRLPMPISFTPTISPLRFTKGPPEFPGKITASWPIQRTNSPTDSPSSRIAPPGAIISMFATIP